MVRVSSKVKALTGKIDTNNENDNLITKIKSEVNEFMSGLPLFKI